jgi:hypothetical protein
MLVKTPHKFITAKLSIRKPGSSSVLIFIGLMNQKLCIYRAFNGGRAITRARALTRAQTQQSERLIARANIRHWSEAYVVLIIF